MESKVTTEFRMDDGEMLFPRFIGGVDSFHTSVKAQNKEILIQAKTQSVGHCYLLIKLIKLENPSRLICITPDGPDITGINKYRPLKLPE